jgi:RNA ligase
MTDPQQYFTLHNLFDIASLRAQSAHKGVDVTTSPKFPDLVMLHYSREAQLDENWNEFSKMCRGLIVDLKNKKILAWPFNKFFNLDEQPESKLSVLLEAGPFTVSEKLDGSMLTLFKDPNTGQFHLTTKGSFESEQGKYATQIMPEVLKQDRFVDEYTFMFELISHRRDLRENLVVDYVRKGYPEGVYLIGARNNVTGQLSTPTFLKAVAEMYNLPVMKTYEFGSLMEVLENSKRLPVMEEGYVLHFPEKNLLVKLKGDDYKRAHKFISKLSPTYLLEGLMHGTIRDLISIAPEEYREDVLDQVHKFEQEHISLTKRIHHLFNAAPQASTRKEFASWVNQNVEADLRGYLFGLFDNKPISDIKIYKTIGTREGLSPRELNYEKTK